MENLTYEEQKIINTLGTGESMAITYKTLSWRTQIGERTVRRIVKHLVEDHLVPIASNSQSGYFIASNWEEANHTIAELKKRGAEDFIRARRFRQACKLHFRRDEQLSLKGM